MPDEALFAAAGEGNLHELEQLEKQARRMLRDPKSKALAEHFGGPWMRLGQVAAVIPDLDAFPSYYEPAGPARRRTVGLHMMLEALLLFETVLVENRSILDFIDATSPISMRTWPRLRAAASLSGAPEDRPQIGRQADLVPRAAGRPPPGRRPHARLDADAHLASRTHQPDRPGRVDCGRRVQPAAASSAAGESRRSRKPTAADCTACR